MFNKKKKNVVQKNIAKAASFKMNNKKIEKIEMKKNEFEKWLSKPGKSFDIPESFLSDKAAFTKDLFLNIARFVSSGSNAVWTWTNLTSTKSDIKFEGGTDKQRNDAKQRTNELDKRINPFPTVQGGGMEFLLDQFFQSIFTVGRFAGNMILDKNLTMVQDFEILDPFKVKFNKEKKTYYMVDANTYLETNKKTFFYYGLDMDSNNPYGSAMFEAATELMKMSTEMIEDMKQSSSNAGVPRLHIKITQPEMGENEDIEDYNKRIESYFDSYIDQFGEIAADDNFYSWEDLDIAVVGGNQTTQFVWKINYQIIDEEIISAFHLYPWVMGKSSSTTKNWVKSQFDLLMSQASSLRTVASNLAGWLRNTDLLLGGFTDVKTKHIFSENRDPSRKDQAVAERFEIGNANEKVRNGIIEPDDGARELGYEKAANPKLWLANQTSPKTIKKGEKAKEEGLSQLSIEELSNQIEDLKEMIIHLSNRDKK